MLNLGILVAYLSVLVVSFLGNATILLPAPSMIYVFVSAAYLNPILLAIVAGIGSALGEVIGYLAGRGGRSLLEKKKDSKLWKQVDHANKLFEKYGGFFVIVIFAATPLPDDVVGLLAGMIKYPLKRFFVASTTGKIIMNLLIAFAGLYSIDWILRFFGLAA